MWAIFENQNWNKYKEIAAVRGLLQWTGISGLLMSIVSLAAIWIWARYALISGPMRYVVSLISLVLVIAVFAGVRLLVGADLIAEPPQILVLDNKGRQRKQSIHATPRKYKKARAIAGVLVMALFMLAYFTGTLNHIAALMKPVPATAIFIDCHYDRLPIRIAAGATIHVFALYPKDPMWGLEDVLNSDQKDFLWPESVVNASKN